MSNQRLRIYAALIIVLATLVGVFAIDLTGHEPARLYEWVIISAVAFLFGVSTNGSGLGGGGKNGNSNGAPR
jgi:hypothetical protein